MRKTLTFLIALFLLATHAVAQKHYVSLNQYDNEWSITHGEDVLFHGTGKVDFNNMPSFIKHVVDSLDSVEPKRPARQLQGHTKRNVHASVVVEPLITTSWHQDAPYNDLMPTINGVHVPAGCATISTAQVINYYHYMQSWTASYDEVYYDGDLFQHENVSWHNPSEVQCPEPVWHVEYSSTGWTNDIAPAKLCEGIAFAQKAFFYANETSTNYFTHYDGIRKKFGYLTEIKETNPYSISAVLKEQLNIQRPVIINAADNSNNGHSFIADGYNSEGEFHLNMGWGESWNCWGAPDLWAYNQTMFTITLYPDYNDEALFIKDNEAGTAVFHNLTTGEVFRQEMSQTPVVSNQTGLPINHSNFYQVDITAGEYEFWLEYDSGKQISAPMPEPTIKELFSSYNNYSPMFIRGASRLNVPYDCRLTFYAEIEVVEQYGFNVILEEFNLESNYAGEVAFSVTNQEGTMELLIPTDYSVDPNNYYKKHGEYITKHIEHIPAGNYLIYVKVHNEEFGDFYIGKSATSIPCAGNDFEEMVLEFPYEGDYWLCTSSTDKWTDEENPYVEPIMITLPERKFEGDYTLSMILYPGFQIYVYAKWQGKPARNGCVRLYMDENEYTPYCSDVNLDFSKVEGLKAYIASGFNPIEGAVEISRVSQVPAGEGMLLKGSSNISYEVPTISEVESNKANLLKGNLTRSWIYPTVGDVTNFVYRTNEDGISSFNSFIESFVIKENQAWLEIPTPELGNNPVSVFSIVEKDDWVTLNPQCNDGNKVYGTFSNTSAWVVPEELTVSAVRVDGESITLDNYATGDIVPANVGVLVSAAQGGNYTIELSNAEGTEKPNNALIGTGGGVTAEYMELIAPDKEYYRLTIHNGTQCGFWWGAENGAAFDLPANQAFLIADTPISPSIVDGYLLIDAKIKQYQLAYVVDGDTISIDSLEHGAIIEPLEEPIKEGYTFSGWSEIPEIMPAHDVTVTGSFIANQYQVAFVVEGDTVQVDSLDFGSAITAPEAPAKDRYVFITWGDVDETVPAHDVTYTAEYALLGDVYEDNMVNVADLTKLVGIILNSSNELTDRQLKIADVYKDQMVNVADYTSLVSLILHSASYATARAYNGDSFSEPKLKAYYTDNSVSIDIENSSNMTALQFDMILPDGYSVSDIVPVNGFDRHAVYSRTNEDGTVRVVVCSANNGLIDKQNKINIALQNRNNNGAVEDVLFTNIIGATNQSCIIIDDVHINVGGMVTGINNTESENGLSFEVSNGYIRITSSKEQTVTIVGVNGMIVDTFDFGCGESRTITLLDGVYVINGKKIMVK